MSATVPFSKDSNTSVDLTSQRSTAKETRSIVVVGAGGHGRELADIVVQIGTVDNSIRLVGIADDGTPDRLTLARAGIRFLGSTEGLNERDVETFIGIGDPSTRARVAQEVGRTGEALVHPSAVVGTGVVLHHGTVLAQATTITTNVVIGAHSHINVGATISHDCVLGDFVTVCPGATLTGAVTIGNGAFVGAGAKLLPGVTIGTGAIIGAGATVIDDVEAGTTVLGTPAQPLH